MANHIAEVAKLLDVEVGETFSINQMSPLAIFRFTDKCLQISTGDGIWITANSGKLCKLLDGRLSIRKLPWKPINGEKYYIPYVSINKENMYDEYQWGGDRTDEAFYEQGIVFKTKEEALAMSEKILAFVKEERENG